MADKVQKIREEVERLKRWNDNVRESTRHMTLQEEDFNRGKHSSYLEILNFIDSMQEEPVSEDLEELINNLSKQFPEVSFAKLSRVAVRVAKWQKEQDQSTIELAEDHAYFAGRTKTIDEINEALLSEVLPCFMHGGEADEVVAKLDEVLNQKK